MAKQPPAPSAEFVALQPRAFKLHDLWVAAKSQPDLDVLQSAVASAMGNDLPEAANSWQVIAAGRPISPAGAKSATGRNLLTSGIAHMTMAAYLGKFAAACNESAKAEGPGRSLALWSLAAVILTATGVTAHVLTSPGRHAVQIFDVPAPIAAAKAPAVVEEPTAPEPVRAPAAVPETCAWGGAKVLELENQAEAKATKRERSAWAKNLGAVETELTAKLARDRSALSAEEFRRVESCLAADVVPRLAALNRTGAAKVPRRPGRNAKGVDWSDSAAEQAVADQTASALAVEPSPEAPAQPACGSSRVSKGVNGRWAQLKTCGEWQQREDADLVGSVRFSWTISADGSVANLAAWQGSAKAPAFVECAGGVIRRIGFGASDEGPCRASISLLFNSGELSSGPAAL